jgi:hypothetical protein
MKLPERKPVDCKNIAIVLVQPASKGVQIGRLGKLRGGAVAQTQSNGISSSRLHPLLHPKCMTLKGIEGLRPIFTGMDVCAVRKMETVFKDHSYTT